MPWLPFLSLAYLNSLWFQHATAATRLCKVVNIIFQIYEASDFAATDAMAATWQSYLMSDAYLGVSLILASHSCHKILHAFWTEFKNWKVLNFAARDAMAFIRLSRPINVAYIKSVSDLSMTQLPQDSVKLWKEFFKFLTFLILLPQMPWLQLTGLSYHISD